jgi:PIN domain nuclease of toxin-antitoxin system
VRYLFDTHLILWGADRPERLGPALERTSEGERLLSAASAWELAIKQGLGKLDLGMPVSDFFRRSLIELGARAVEVTVGHASAVEHLPAVHRDPFDRLLVAQASLLDATLLTADRTLAAYGSVVEIV